MRRFTILTTILSSAVAAADSSAPDTEVFFDHNSSALDARDLMQLDVLATVADDIPGTKFVLDAHTDASGSAPYNVGLSIRRARSVRDFLTMRGFDPDRIVIVAYGEDGPRRGASARDRRVSVTLTAEPLYSIIDASSPGFTAIVWNEPVTLAEIEGPADKIPQTARR